MRLWSSACLAARALPGACRRCADACPVQALRIADEGPALAGSCTGCGRCARACPTGALSVEGFDSPGLLPIGNQFPTVDCWKVPPTLSGARAMRVPCLAGVGAEHVLEWATGADGTPIGIRDRGWCAACSAAAGGNPAAALADTAAGLLAECGLPEALRPRLVRSPLPVSLMPAEIPQPLSQVRVDRRGFFRQLIQEAVGAPRGGVGAGLPAISTAAIAGKPAPTGPAPAAACAIPKRKRLLDAARTLAARHGRPVPGSLFPQLQVTQDCDHGQGCVTLCPTGALRAYETDGHAGVEFEARDCVACGLCVRACRRQALALAPSSHSAPCETQTLTHFPLRRCADCLEPYAGIGEQTRCPECRRHHQMARQLFGTPR